MFHQMPHGHKGAYPDRVDYSIDILHLLAIAGLVLLSKRIESKIKIAKLQVDHIAFHMGGANVGSRIKNAHAFGPSWIVTWKLQLFGGYGILRVAVFLGQSIAAFGQLVAESFPQTRLFGQCDHSFRITEVQGSTYVLLGQQAFFEQLHGAADGHAHRNGIQPQLIAKVVGLDDRLQLIHAARRAQGGQGFIFRSFALSLPAGMIHFCDAAAGNRTAPAGAGTNQIFLGQNKS